MATKNIVPRENGEGSIGTSGKKWDKVFTNDVILADGESVMAKFMNVPVKSTTLSGYGISDAYTKTETDNMLNNKAGKDDTYTKTETDNMLDNVEALLANKLDKTEAEENYLPLSGGNITDTLTVKGKEVECVNLSEEECIRYESGLQICWGSANGTSGEINTYTFENPFVASPRVVGSGFNSSNADTYSVESSRIVTLRATSDTAFKWQANSPTKAAGTVCRFIAIGQWK